MKSVCVILFILFTTFTAQADVISIAGETGKEIYNHLNITPVTDSSNPDIELIKQSADGLFKCSYLIPPSDRYVCRLNLSEWEYNFQSYALVIEGRVAESLYKALDFSIEQVSDYSNVGGSSAFAMYGNTFHCTEYDGKYCCIF